MKNRSLVFLDVKDAVDSVLRHKFAGDLIVVIGMGLLVQLVNYGIE